MNFSDFLLNQKRLLLAVSISCSVLGLFFWYTMPRQEDPSFPSIYGNIAVSFPGASAETMERLIVEPLEEELATVAELDLIHANIQLGFAVIQLELVDTTEDIAYAWDEVQRAIDQAERQFPQGVSKPLLNRERVDQESIVIAISGTEDPLILLDAARDFKKVLLRENNVKEVKMIGDPGEQITVAYQEAVIKRLGLSAQAIASQLQGKSQISPGGTLKIYQQQLILRPDNEFLSLDELRKTPILLPTGTTIPLSEIATITYSDEVPRKEISRYQQQPAVMLGIVPAKKIHLVSFGEHIQDVVEEWQKKLAPLKVEIVIYQPKYVKTRLKNLQNSLIQSAATVAIVLFIFMGWRVGLVVATVVPMVLMMGVAVYALTGGVLQQMSIAALVIAIGLLVDNGIVVTESIKQRLETGMSVERSVDLTIATLWLPLASATATTIAAFIPMLISEGVVGKFTRAIPTVVMITLIISYFVAITVTPIISTMLLKPSIKYTINPLQNIGERIGHLSYRIPWLIIIISLVLMMVASITFIKVKQAFFPLSDRNQLLVQLRLPEGTHIDTTEQMVIDMETFLHTNDKVIDTVSFIGRSTPHFYYNLQEIPFRSNLAQMVVNGEGDINEMLRWIRTEGKHTFPQAEIIVKKLEQGPPIDAPVEIRIYGEKLEDLHKAAETALALLREVPGTVDERHTLGVGIPTMRLHINDANAARFGLNRADIAEALYTNTLGLTASYYRQGEDPVPIIVRTDQGELLPLNSLENIYIISDQGQEVPLSQLVTLQPEWQPAVIERRDQQRAVRVLSQYDPQITTASAIVSQVAPELKKAELPYGITYSIGGEFEGSRDANLAILAKAPLGGIVLFAVLIAQLNSFRRLFIVLATMPLAAVGTFPGLWLTGQPFGFMSLLGLFTLTGIVVNNAILLLEVVIIERKVMAERISEDFPDENPIQIAGRSLQEAIAMAVATRLRPIVLTMLTTIAGLTPLLLSESPLFPPMAATIIAGLIASTLLTLFVIPALTWLLFKPKGYKNMIDGPI